MLFQPLVYQVATGALSAAGIAMPLRALLRRQRSARVLLAEVRGFDLERREVPLTNFEQRPPVGHRLRHADRRGRLALLYFGHENCGPTRS